MVKRYSVHAYTLAAGCRVVKEIAAKTIGMDSKGLSIDQLATLYHKLTPSIQFLDRLLLRMDQKSFPANDPLRMSVVEARQAVVRLRTQVETHILRQRGGRKAWAISKQLGK